MNDLDLGVIHAATPTPILDDGSLDTDGSNKLFKRICALGLDGVHLLGSMGEGPYLPDATRYDFVEYAVGKIKSIVTIFASVADSSKKRMIERAKRYEISGVDIYHLPDSKGLLEKDNL